jgi:hypothetical protein
MIRCTFIWRYVSAALTVATAVIASFLSELFYAIAIPKNSSPSCEKPGRAPTHD